jgi:hypothetical protein
MTGTPLPPQWGAQTYQPYQRLNNLVRIELESERDGLASHQKHDITVRRVGYGYSYGHSYGGIP